MSSLAIVLAILFLCIVYIVYNYYYRRKHPLHDLVVDEDDVMGQDPTLIDEVSASAHTTSMHRDSGLCDMRGSFVLNPIKGALDSGRLTLSKPHLRLQCHKSILLSLAISRHFLVFVYDESNDIFLYDIKRKREIKIPLEKGGFATCAQCMLADKEKDETLLFLCTDTFESGYCVNKYQLLNYEQMKQRKAKSEDFSLNSNRDYLVEDDSFQPWKHPGLICQIECVRAKYLITRCEDHDICFILDIMNGSVLTKIATSQFKIAMFASSFCHVANASVMNSIKVFTFSDVLPRKQKSQQRVSKPKTVRRSSRHDLENDDEKILYQRMELTGHRSSVQSVCFSPKAHQLASVSNDGTIRLWSLQNCANDSRCILEKPLPSIMQKNFIVLLDALSLEEVYRITAKSYITTLRWSGDARYIISGHLDGEANFWKVSKVLPGK